MTSKFHFRYVEGQDFDALPRFTPAPAMLALINAALDDKDAALALTERAMALVPVEKWSAND